MGADATKQGFGTALQVLSALESLRSPGGLGRFLTDQAQALSDPRIRSVVEGSPFRAGFFGVGGEQQLLNAPTGSQPPEIAFRANLPPLDPQTAELQDLARRRQAAFATQPEMARLVQGLATPQDIESLFVRLGEIPGAGNVVIRPPGTGVTVAQQPILALDQTTGRPLLVDPQTGSVQRQLPETTPEKEEAKQQAQLQAMQNMLRFFGVDPASFGGGDATAAPSAPPTAPTAPAPPFQLPDVGRTPARLFSGEGILNDDVAPQLDTAPSFRAPVNRIIPRTVPAQPPTTVPATTLPSLTTSTSLRPAAPTTTTTTPPTTAPPTTTPPPTTTTTFPSVPVEIDLPDIAFPSPIQGGPVPPARPLGPIPASTERAAGDLATGAAPSPPAAARLQDLEGAAAPVIITGPNGLTLETWTTAVGGTKATFSRKPTLKDAQLLALDLFGTTDLATLQPNQVRDLRQTIKDEEEARGAREKLLAGLTGEQFNINNAWGSSAQALEILINQMQTTPQSFEEFVGLGGLRAPLATLQERLTILSPRATALRQLLARMKLAGFQWGGRALTSGEAARVDVQVPLGTEPSFEVFRSRMANFAGQLAGTAELSLSSGLQFRLTPEAQEDMRRKIAVFNDFFQSHFAERLQATDF